MSGARPMNRTALCDCGQPKDHDAHGCRRCVWLDGRTEAQREVIGGLREHVRLTIKEMVALGCAPSINAAYSTVTTLLRKGRVRRDVDPDEGPQMEASYALVTPLVQHRDVAADLAQGDHHV